MKALMVTLLVILCSSCIIVCNALPLFWHGMLTGGVHGAGNNYGLLVKERWITQRLNHFDDSNLQTWQQRYFVNDTFYKPGGPVFLMIWGESEAYSVWIQEGMWIEWARQIGALCLMLEHRYYGMSHPTKDVSTSNLRYLSSEQALADLAYFRNYMMQNMSMKSEQKWVSFGGSYSGSLSAWFRLKYPHLVDMAVASSAPVRVQMNFTGYLEVMRDSLATSKIGETCNTNIQGAVNQMEKLLQDKAGWKTITKAFRLCKPLQGNIENDVANLFMSLAGNFMGVVQYNNNNKPLMVSSVSNVTIDTVCDIMGNSSYGDNMARYAAINSLMLDSYEEKCLDIGYDDMIQEMKETSWTSPESVWGRQWMYQKCTEFGFFHTSDSAEQPFGTRFPLSFCLQQCADIFGKQFNYDMVAQGIEWNLLNYGGDKIKASRVIFPNGSIDPWHVRGILHDLSTDQLAVFINGTAHCADMDPPAASDPPQLVEARQTIFFIMETWLKE
ncbi:LOW QUALITY PROTEIN: putative serine protease K12H4.7 [Amphiura filiformis]|uniref:LOW QUALITY PROTEIN: putative serine protease K12H4.7 n=1 Tax=Amphiura filiformis TaxID=82378 RepID=UPI003B20E4D0